MAFTLPELGYAHDALEPYIDAKTMEIHHGKHHQAYVDNLNKALEGQSKFQEMKICELNRHIREVPQEMQTAVRNNGGGHYNHTLFWDIMTPGGSKQPTGESAKAIEETFGSFEEFKTKFKDAAIKRFGSGWAWLVVDPQGKVSIESTPNQDNPLMEGKEVALGLDVWEHAYYLNYQNKRPDYIEAWFHVVNWDKVEERFQKAKQIAS